MYDYKKGHTGSFRTITKDTVCRIMRRDNIIIGLACKDSH